MWMSKGIKWSNQLSLRQKLVIPWLLLLLIITIFYRCDISYQYQSLNRLMNKRQWLLAKMIESQRYWAKLNNYEIALLQKQNFFAFYPSDCHLVLDNVTLVQQIIDLGQQSGLTNKAINPQANKPSNDEVLASFRIECLGSYAALQIFLQKILEFPVQIIVEQCQIQKTDTDANLFIQLTLKVTSWNNKPCHF